ncbi:MAG: hypothetical protein Q9201_003576 [Fulgogasparrea decipioides]
MPSAILPTLSADEIDDLLYLARANDLHDLKAGIEVVALAQNTSINNILQAIVDPESGNSLLHMVCANNCLDVLGYLLDTSPEQDNATQSTQLNVNLKNLAGNTPLHWAAMNGHLGAVKMLVLRGADTGVKNNVGHDAVFEAERGGKEEVVGWLLGQQKGVECNREGDGLEGEIEVDEEDVGAEGVDIENGTGDGVEEVENGVEKLKMEKGD